MIRLAAVLFTLLISACAPIAVTGPIDGDYRGSMTRFQALRRTCMHNRLLQSNIRNNTMFFPWEGQYIQATASSNGTVSGSLPGVQLTGTYNGTIVEGDVTDGSCAFHYTLKKNTG